MGKKEFKAETKRLMELMIHSVYSQKEIFLRELISNASDAIDKRLFLALTDPAAALAEGEEYEILLTLDKENRILTVSDNGIGMDEEDLEQHLGVIAKSGSLQFKEEHAGQEGEEDSAAEIIGRFGVGFYSAFMVADSITVETRKLGCGQAWRWESSGVDGFTITPCEREKYGTSVAMHIREDGEEKDEFSQYLREYPLYKLVKKYSDYIRWPIKLWMPAPKIKEGSDPQNPEFEEFFEFQTLNSMRPIWAKSRGEVSREEYEEYFKEHFNSPDAPKSVIVAAVEGNVSYKAVLYIPVKPSVNYDTDDYEPGLELYSNGVKIMDRCPDLVPEYYNFVRGVVDSPDISLNLSREMLQQDRQVKMIAANLEKKIRAELDKMMREDRKGYEEFYRNFGRQIKVCAMEDFGAKRDKLADLLLFWSSRARKLITLNDYVANMREGQKFIYFAAGPTLMAIDNLPQTELVKENRLEMLYFTDHMDELVAEMFGSYKDIPFRSVTDGDLELEGAGAGEASEEQNRTLEFIKKTLGRRVDEVKPSAKLKSHPVILSSGEGITFEMERYLNAMNSTMGAKARRILEVNLEHEAFRALEAAREADPARARKYCEVLYQQGRLIAGLGVEDPTAYTDLLVSLW